MGETPTLLQCGEKGGPECNGQSPLAIQQCRESVASTWIPRFLCISLVGKDGEEWPPAVTSVSHVRSHHPD